MKKPDGAFTRHTSEFLIWLGIRNSPKSFSQSVSDIAYMARARDAAKDAEGKKPRGKAGDDAR